MAAFLHCSVHQDIVVGIVVELDCHHTIHVSALDVRPNDRHRASRLSFIQSYAVDKKLSTEDLSLERVDVITGAVLTGIIGFFVVVACAATLHRDGRSILDAADAAVALEPLAGSAASTLFAVGLIGAAFLAASASPLSTAYSVCEYAGTEAAVDDSFSEAKTFYVTFGAVTAIGAVAVLTPNIPLVTILVATQVMGRFTIGRPSTVAYSVTTAVVVFCVIALAVTSVSGRPLLLTGSEDRPTVSATQMTLDTGRSAPARDGAG